MTDRFGRHGWQRTKIVCTLGPATDAPGVLEALVRNGMDVARINMSHGTHADHAARIESVRRVSRALSEPIGILADLPGPKRSGSSPAGRDCALSSGIADRGVEPIAGALHTPYDGVRRLAAAGRAR